MCSFIYNVGKSIIDGIKDCLFLQTGKNDNKIFPQEKSKNEFSFKYDESEIFWCEWWTLYFYGGAGNKIFGMINYIYIKGLNEIGKCIIYPAICDGDNKYNSFDYHDIKDFVHNDNLIKISTNEINKLSDDKYTFEGCNKDNNIKWNLTIDKEKYSPLNVAQNLKLGIKSIVNLPITEKLSFSSVIPLGSITGNITLFGKTFEIKQCGEMEHLWGNVVLPTINWNLMFGSDTNHNLIYWLHTPMTSTQEEKGCIYLNLNNNVHLIRDYEIYEQKSNNEYPDVITIKCPINNLIITYNVLTLSASNDGNASENHVKITILSDNKIYELFGMAEYHRSKNKILIN
ncbi:hypothetical protein Catovirus_1_947 [Catovirus CTV1]|uniref:Uncharacterized protein n=1 Tax=Catovirus CTV1 TaxID=1977631 RepID=A0A1V0SB04_9VIRU|nr:hypothetical protein Catovirus_1_947 [Catovirus CTV1]